MSSENNYYDTICSAAEYIRGRICGKHPLAALILGSGWGDIAGQIENPVRIPYREVPGMAVSTVPGHAGEWICGSVGEKDVLLMSGRLHPYEGHSMRDVVMPIYIMKMLGIETVVVTNAAGAINTAYSAGDMMIITDHINFTAKNPLTGENDDRLGTRFPDMSAAYDKSLSELALKIADKCDVMVHAGVYLQSTGPSFETPAEIRMFRALGADAVGMSTVPEVIAAKHAGLRVAGFSCMTNMAAGVLEQPLSHAEVLETAERVREPYGRFVRKFIESI